MNEILLIIVTILIILLSVALYQKTTNAICISRKRLDGQTVIVTGGTAGMGLHVATDLAHRGARVIIACPFEDEGINARKQIIQETENENVVFKLLDLSSLKSVRHFAADILSTEDKLHILLNKAGVLIFTDEQTQDGMNFIMQVNYYGTFLLTLLLLPLLKITGKPEDPSRILTLGSFMHMIGSLDIEKLNITNYWYKFQIYSNSKICLVSFAYELTKKLKGTNVVINCVDPGAVGTRILNTTNEVFGFIASLVCSGLFKTPWQGCQTALHVALDKEVGKVSGAYFKNCKLAVAVKRAYCDAAAKTLWEDSVRLVKLTENELQQCFPSLEE